MNLEYKHLLPADFSPLSKVWIYQSSRLFSMAEAVETENILNNFTSAWVSHGAPVKGFSTLLFGQFIILMADETATTVGGCSTDTSTRLIKELEKRFDINLFDRTTLAFIIKDKLQLLPLTQVNYAIENGFINKDTLFFNNIVVTKKDLQENWLIPVEKSWLSKRLSLKAEN
jgi:hypothetical protein